MLIVVRHAVAVHRVDWSGSDATRPLTSLGERQAEGLVGRLAGLAIERILSSPAERCVATVEALSRHRGIAVEECGALGLEDEAAMAELPELLRDEDLRDAVLCTHGETITRVLALLPPETDGAAGRSATGAIQWPKGSTWVLRRTGDGRVLGRYLPPPVAEPPSSTREDPRWHQQEGAPAPSPTPTSGGSWS